VWLPRVLQAGGDAVDGELDEVGDPCGALRVLDPAAKLGEEADLDERERVLPNRVGARNPAVPALMVSGSPSLPCGRVRLCQFERERPPCRMMT
jgi:hypothetical protein